MVLSRIRMKRLRAIQPKLTDLDASIILKGFIKPMMKAGGEEQRNCDVLPTNQKKVFLKLEQLRINGYDIGRYTYHEAISLFSHYKADIPVETLFLRMEAAQIEPYKRTWIPIMHTLPKSKAEKIWERIPSSVKSDPSSQKLWAVYTGVTRKDTTKDMMKHGVQPTRETYTSILRISRPEDALKAFKMIKDPTPIDRYLLLKATARTGDFEKVFSNGPIRGYPIVNWYLLCLLSIKLRKNPPNWDKVEQVMSHINSQKPPIKLIRNIYSLLLDICLQNASHAREDGDKWASIGENILQQARRAGTYSKDHPKTLAEIYSVCGMSSKKEQLNNTLTHAPRLYTMNPMVDDVR
eukprot:TRINITY_DN87_c8_g1_i1.p1 TRINITY_DN87_c8_g1~~TRINITY_DN87_c8_g1_i1.p1  ORF type:complete len:351 (+),score=58.80 TRINITY_DN87_c8_g1_i1:300-1352(+)